MYVQLTDLHVYVIPPDHWRSHLHSAANQIINEAVSAGFIRYTCCFNYLPVPNLPSLNTHIYTLQSIFEYNYIHPLIKLSLPRVLPESTIYSLREELEQQLGFDVLPQQYVFLKSVGRCLTRVRVAAKISGVRYIFFGVSDQM